MKTNFKVDTQHLEENGYILIKNVFTSEEIEQMRSSVADNLAKQKIENKVKYIQDRECMETELLSMNGLSDVILDDRILYIAQSILKEKLVYYGDSCVSIGHSLGAWHKDNRQKDRWNHSGFDWQEKYTVIRIGIYLQDHLNYSGGLGIRLGSHRPCKWILFLEKFRPKKVFEYFRSLVYKYYGKPIIVGSEPGDVVVWYLTTTHAGHSIRFKPFPKLRMPRWFEKYAPKSWHVPEQKRREVLFMTFGINDDHMKRYVDHLKTKPSTQEIWKRLSISEEIVERARSKNVDLLFPEEYLSSKMRQKVSLIR